MKSILFVPLAVAALGLAACSGPKDEPVVNETALNIDEGVDANLAVDETTDLNAAETSLNAADANVSTDAAINATEGNTAGNAL